MKKSLFFLLFICLANSNAFSEESVKEFTFRQFGKDVEKGMSQELRKWSWLELYKMSENDPPIDHRKYNVFGRVAREKLLATPDPVQRAFYDNYAKYLNVALDRAGLRDFLRQYERFTKIDIRFNVGELQSLVPIIKPTGQDNLFLETKAAIAISESGDSHAGLKFDPQGMDLERIQNFTVFAGHRSFLGRAEVRYSTFNKLAIILDKENFLIPKLNVSAEYKTLDERIYLGTAYELGRGWHSKFSGSHSTSKDNFDLLVIFYHNL